MNQISRILVPAVTAGLVLLCSGTFIYLRSTIEPIPQTDDTVFAAYSTDRVAVQSVNPDESSVSAADLLPENLPEQGYLIKLNADTLYVYPEGSREPSAAYELPAEWLPDYDRILLEYGFRVSDSTELRELLEDYIS